MTARDEIQLILAWLDHVVPVEGYDEAEPEMIYGASRWLGVTYPRNYAWTRPGVHGVDFPIDDEVRRRAREVVRTVGVGADAAMSVAYALAEAANMLGARTQQAAQLRELAVAVHRLRHREWATAEVMET